MKDQLNALIDLIKDSDNKIKLLEHNGESILEYPTKLGWYLAPFPMEKGLPYNADNLTTISRAAFQDDPEFIKAKAVGESRWLEEGKKRDISWRLNTMLWAVSHALRQWDKESIFVECGTGRGYMAAAICSYYKWDASKPKFFLIDSFEPYVPDVSGSQKETNQKSFVYAEGDEEIREYFKDANVEIIKGFIPEILSELPDSKIGFLHMDLNSAVAESSALEAFGKSMGASLLTLPTGQAIYFHI